VALYCHARGLLLQASLSPVHSPRRNPVHVLRATSFAFRAISSSLFTAVRPRRITNIAVCATECDTHYNLARRLRHQ
jgi:hypothetical protein